MAESYNREQGLYDVDYGVVSAAITATGVTIITTTGANYHGIKLISNTAAVTIKAYDSLSAATGNILDVIFLGVTSGTNSYMGIPTKAKVGVVVSVTGTGATAVCFYGPRG